MTEPPLSVSVVIPCGRPDHIGDCVESVWAAKGARDVEVVVVTPDAEFIPIDLRERVVIVPVDELYAPGRMRNIGVTRATGDVLVFLDDDCRCPEGWIDEMVDALIFRSRSGWSGVVCVRFLRLSGGERRTSLCLVLIRRHGRGISIWGPPPSRLIKSALWTPTGLMNRCWPRRTGT